MTKLRIKNSDGINYATLTKIVFMGIYLGMILTMSVALFG